MLVSSIKPSVALSPLLKGSFPAFLLGRDTIPFFSINDCENEKISEGNHTTEDLVATANFLLSKLHTRLSPIRCEVLSYQEEIRKSFKPIGNMVVEDLYFYLSLDYIYSIDSPNLIDIDFRYYSVNIGENSARDGELLYRIDEVFFDLISIIYHGESIPDKFTSYLNEFYLTLSDVLAFRRYLLNDEILQDERSGIVVVEICESVYKESYLSGAERKLIYE